MFTLLLLASFLHLVTPQTISTHASIESVREIVCPVNPTQSAQGTATVVGKNMVLTDYHVIDGRTEACEFEGQSSVGVLYSNPDEDIAVVAVNTGDITPVPISCDGLVPGKEYLAIGYPGFLNNHYEAKLVMTGTFPNVSYNVVIVDKPPIIAGQLLIATAEHHDFPKTKEYPYDSHNLTVMLRNVYEGMSGGPILNDRNEIVGLITSRYGKERSANRDLKDTGLCR